MFSMQISNAVHQDNRRFLRLVVNRDNHRFLRRVVKTSHCTAVTLCQMKVVK